MPLDCPRCTKSIEYSGERPSFCPYCGVALSSVSGIPRYERTSDFVDGSQLTIDFRPSEPGNDGVPATIGGYRLIRLLGAGGMGAVYEGVLDDSGQRVAVKLLHAPAKADQSALDRFRQEGQLASQLSHPRCVFVLGADEEAGKPYIVMELTPGVTLRDWVRERGPLPVPEAIAKIVDVIDGLIEAHRLNILHRDVKPSNCFVMSDGRVKVGDFGLSKSLRGNANLTQSGAFLGTVLYAAPEQIRGDPLDFTADVYSVCATLYYLLTGQAPFQHENPAVVISRAMSEAPPDILMRRPDLPRRLARIVMRGLERDPAKRYANLEELRAALVELQGRPLNRGGLGSRAVACFIDFVVVVPIWLILTTAGDWLRVGEPTVWVLLQILYFAIGEYAFGASVGKWLLRLRVTHLSGTPPSFGRVAVRSVVFVALSIGVGLFAEALFERYRWLPSEAAGLVSLCGIAALLAPMRSRNGYRGLHEWVSGTRVVQLAWPRRLCRVANVAPAPVEPGVPGGLPGQFGGYKPDRLLEQNGRWYRLHVDDPILRREMHLLVRPETEPPLSDARRNLAHPTRTRWLAGGVVDGWAWDAMLAPAGAPLPAVAAVKPLGWPETLVILEQLTDAIEDGLAAGTLCEPIAADNVFVRSDGRVQILDPLSASPLTEPAALDLLRQIAPLALEGRPREHTDLARPPHAILPLHARETLCRLAGSRQPPFTDIASFRAALRELETEPTETTTPQRLLSLTIQAIAFSIPLLLLLAWSALFNLPLAITAQETWYQSARATLMLEDDPAFLAREIPGLGDPSVRDKVLTVLQTRNRLGQRDLDWVNPGLNVTERFLRRTILKYDDDDPVSPGRPESEEFALLRQLAINPSLYAEGTPVPGLIRQSAADLATVYFFVVAVFLAGVSVWSALTRGGIGLAMAGLALVRRDGRRATWWQCGLRALAIFAVPLALLSLCVAVKAYQPHWVRVHSGLWWAGFLWFAAYGFIGILRPGRGPQDQVTGLYVVPR